MGWETYGRSKIPLKLVVITIIAVAVNFALVLAFQASVSYRYPDPIDMEDIIQYDSRYEGGKIVDMTWHSAIPDANITVYLVEMPDGQYELVTARKHYLFDRSQFSRKGCVTIEPSQTSVKLRVGSTFSYLELRYKEGSPQPDIVMTGMSGITGRQAFFNPMLLSIAALSIVEFIAYCLLFKREELL